MAGKVLRTLFPGAFTEEDARKKEILQYLPTLADRGYSPKEINEFADGYIRGEFKLPTTRSKMIPPSSGVGPSNQVEEDIQFAEPQTALVNPYTGQRMYVRGKGSNVKTYGKDPTQTKPEDVDLNVYNEETGQVENKGKIKKGSKVITTKKDKPMADRDKAQRFQLFKEKGKLRDIMLSQEMDTSAVDSELETMAPEFGYSYQELSEDPTWWQKLTGQEPEKTRTLKRDESATEKPGKYASAQDVKAAYKAGTLSKEQATSILQKDFGMK